MIPDELQDQAAIYILGGLNAEEIVSFEKAMRGSAELQSIVREMREAAGDLGRSVPQQLPTAELKQRVLREIAFEKQARMPSRPATFSPNWLPWAIAALLLVFCGILVLDRTRLQHELAEMRGADPLTQANLVTLVSPTGEHPDAKATVAWQPDRQSGVILINNMPPAGQGRDYQLWAVDSNHKDPISAGILHLDSKGVTRIRFKPDQEATAVKAFAISVEREGGVQKREGPIVMIGNT
jgi:anti-sigma-K factor RskA